MAVRKNQLKRGNKMYGTLTRKQEQFYLEKELKDYMHDAIVTGHKAQPQGEFVNLRKRRKNLWNKWLVM